MRLLLVVLLLAAPRLAVAQDTGTPIKPFTIHVADTTLTIELGQDDVRTVRRTTQPVRSIKTTGPAKAAP